MLRNIRQRGLLIGLLAAILTIPFAPSMHLSLFAQSEETDAVTAEPECLYFTDYEQYGALGMAALQRIGQPEMSFRRMSQAGAQTEEVSRALGPVIGARPGVSVGPWISRIDFHIFSTLQNKNIAPAGLSSDAEFLRRVTLDLTGRIPTADQIRQFLADTDPQKRARAIDRLLDSPEWVDRWAMWLGDLLKNNSASSQINRGAQGRDALHQYIRTSLQYNKPYNQFVAELISGAGDSYGSGPANFIVGGRMSMGPVQDTYDRQWVQTATMFLGLKNFDCLLCHNGAGHLDWTNLWGSQVTRAQAWGMAAFFSRTRLTRSSRERGASYVVQDVARGNYTLNTTSGNRPQRQPAEGQSRTVTPAYLFSGRRASARDDYRQVLAEEVTSDFQFARATVNYIWAHFFSVGIVEPPDAFDLARLDPDNPPPAPWSLQPSHPELLDELARFFIRNNYDLKALMREIGNSRAYQLSSRYEGAWDTAYMRLFARHLVRRLDAEELHDAIVDSSGVPSDLRLRGYEEPFSRAMQLPDTNEPGGAVGTFLNTFLRGNRDDNPRRRDTSVAQALALMNDSFVVGRVGTSSRDGMLAGLLGSGMDNGQFVDALYLNVLSRHPTDEESVAAQQLLQSGNRRTRAEDLLWALYNKVDFVFNY